MILFPNSFSGPVVQFSKETNVCILYKMQWLDEPNTFCRLVCSRWRYLAWTFGSHQSNSYLHRRTSTAVVAKDYCTVMTELQRIRGMIHRPVMAISHSINFNKLWIKFLGWDFKKWLVLVLLDLGQCWEPFKIPSPVNITTMIRNDLLSNYLAVVSVP